MADLTFAFSDLYQEVEKFLGTYNSGSAASGDVTDAKFIVNRAYARFCSYFDWTFLSQERQLITNSTDWKYTLPSDFGYLIVPKLYYDDDDSYPPVEQRPTSYIRELRASAVTTMAPSVFALQAGPYHKQTGQTWEIWLGPTPDAVYHLQYFCKINPQKLVDDTDIPIGAEFSDCLLQLCLAYAEQYKDERKAVNNEVLGEILGAAKSIDNRRRSSMLGYLNGGKVVDIDESDVHHGNVIVSSS